MKSFFDRLKIVIIFIAGTILTFEIQSKPLVTKHTIQLQLADSLGFPVAGTEFCVTVDIIKNGPLVTIQLPLINFQTGQTANVPSEPPALIPGGYLYTSDCFLPKEFRPTDLVPQSIVAACNNGLSPVFSYTQNPNTFPNPPAGYIVQVTNAGALVVQCAGTFGNIIPPGPQILMPTTITYRVESKEKLCKNIILSKGFTNTTQFIDATALENGVRDSHVNDAFDGLAVWAWSDNSTVPDKTNGTMNLMVSIGNAECHGRFKIGDPIQLTNFDPGIQAWDTAVAINRTDKNNIVVSFGHIDTITNIGTLYRAVSFDGGKTWPINGPLNVQPVPGFGDARGVASDKFGNIWYSATQLDHVHNPAIFYVSTDMGDTYTQIYITPVPPGATNFYDYPQYCFGTDENGNYGLYFQTTLFDGVNRNQTPTVGFIPINGLGAFGAPTFFTLTGLMNAMVETDLTASANGRVWLQGITNYGAAYTYISPIILAFKSPGPLDQNYAGSWQTIILNDSVFQYNITNVQSQPIKGYIYHATQSILYDGIRDALYALVCAQEPDYAQNMRLFFIISRDNGQTWSKPIDIANCAFANRGFQSMALDEMTGDLFFGWYDGRNDPSFKSLQYFAGRIPSCKLDQLVCALPLSNPLYTVPSAA